jgi:hypothetical protein
MGRSLRTLKQHSEDDALHERACRAFIEDRFGEKDLRLIDWTVDFVAEQLVAAQIWIARSLTNQQT